MICHYAHPALQNYIGLDLGKQKGPPYANAGCCPVIIIIAVTDDSSNARTTGTMKSLIFFLN